MREILFRRKRIDNGEWVEGGFYIEDYTDKTFILRWNSFGLGFMESIEVDRESSGQYTGMKDMNGQRIFEGDIVLPVLPDRVAQRGFVWPKMPVAFEDGAFALLDSHGSIPLRSFAPTVTFEVVGNIHDNPDLLKEEA